MKRAPKAAGKPVATFPLHAQRVAIRANSADPSGLAGRPPGAPATQGDPILRARRFLALFAASLIAALPAHAFAQEPVDDSVSVRDRSRDEYDPLGMRFGGFTLHASVGLNATYNSNVTASEINEQEDVIFSVTPRARLQSNWSRHALSFEGGAAFDRYNDLDDADAETYYVGAVGRVDIGSNTQVSGIARYAQEVEERTNPDALTIESPVEYTRSELAASIQHTFNRVRLRGTVAQYEYDYDSAFGQDFRDMEETRFTGRVDVAVTPRIGWIFEASTDERDYKNTPTLSSDGTTYLTGVNVNLTDLMRGELTFGQFEREYPTGDVDGTAIAANLEWYITRLTTLTFFASQTGEESGAVVALPYTATNVGMRADHELQRNVILTGGVSFGERDYEPGGIAYDRQDEFFSADAGVDYIMNRRVAFNLRYRHEELESSGANRYRDFDQDVISAGVSLRL
jgi:hypothetical protein